MKLQLYIQRFKLLIMMVALLLLFFPTLSCADRTVEGTTIENKNSQQQNDSASTGETPLKIKLTVDTAGGEKAVYATLYDNSVSRDLLSRLPLTLEFSDYNGTETIARLPAGSPGWDTSDAPNSCDPAPGDITMYAPWGNLAIFYRDYGPSRGLVPMGKLDPDGLELFSSQTGNFTVEIPACK
ncbi:MAG: cyclophilin-like fold protein [Candidatus Treponema excrementipullorum]|nr:cyclophilin-like fold protein [Spirochaetia bacterium]MCI6953121.1 cyclophilin-like fold protein [Spirochaetia bacterium]MDD7012921.1 cyclophilin-like fold protein [Candidatus Treponema excrementipullorum]MDY4708583.1 cyclophilin-like fold protein [Candidatus Treponema excrementipullorum]